MAGVSFEEGPYAQGAMAQGGVSPPEGVPGYVRYAEGGP